VVPPVFKTGSLADSAKLAKENPGFFDRARPPKWPIQRNSVHKNVYSPSEIAKAFRLSRNEF